MERQEMEYLRDSLLPGKEHSLKARPDETILNGHHRIYVLRQRGVDVDALPRDIIRQEGLWRMWTELHWVEGPWTGRLALASRPRGDDWLREELAHWKALGVDGVLSTLEPAEELALELGKERAEAASAGLAFWSLPIPDRDIPPDEASFRRTLANVEQTLASGKNVVVHCRQGVGRTGLVAACLLISRGVAPAAAVTLLSEARGIAVPETDAQREWLDRFAAKRAKRSVVRRRSRRAA